MKTAIAVVCLVLVSAFVVLVFLIDPKPDCKADMPWMAEVCRK